MKSSKQRYQNPPGTFDIVPRVLSPEEKWRESRYWQWIREIFFQVADSFGCQEISTPLFEFAELFSRSAGENSDVVSKEMYLFSDRGQRQLALRPEGTASVVRAVLENQLHLQDEPCKLFYWGPMCRYERQQKGRYRHFYQFGVEYINRKDPAEEAELISLAYMAYQKLAIPHPHLLLNSVGDSQTRKRYTDELKLYLAPHEGALSPTSQSRLKTNLWRILDSKEPEDLEIVKHAPSILDCLSPESAAHFEAVTNHLNRLKIPFSLAPQLVRGLDYYEETVFEFIPSALEKGSQTALGAGGRYNNLSAQLGGAALPSVGFAVGIERLIQALIAAQIECPIDTTTFFWIVPLGEAAKIAALEFSLPLRAAGIRVQITFDAKKLQKTMGSLAKITPTYLMVLGDEELTQNMAQIKVMATKETLPVELSQLTTTIKNLYYKR